MEWLKAFTDLYGKPESEEDYKKYGAFRRGVEAAKQSVQLTALRRWLAVSIFINIILLVVVLFTIGGN